MKIQDLKLYTNQIEDLKTFYLDILELPGEVHSSTMFSVQVGWTRVRFEENPVADSTPVYHFAINIPSNLFDESKKWLSERVDLLEKDGSSEVYFKFWEAKALYAFDPAGNIVEWISRKENEIVHSQHFSHRHMLGVSEIGLVVNDVQQVSRELQDAIGAGTYSIDNEEMSMVGDPAGVIIVTKIDRTWLMTDIPAAVHPMEITVESNRCLRMDIKGYPYKFNTIFNGGGC
ncbi:ring-cleaving dioxygenase [bacterium]|nr:ring-cleaving dioxygenase [bacterium]